MHREREKEREREREREGLTDCGVEIVWDQGWAWGLGGLGFGVSNVHCPKMTWNPNQGKKIIWALYRDR